MVSWEGSSEAKMISDPADAGGADSWSMEGVGGIKVFLSGAALGPAPVPSFRVGCFNAERTGRTGLRGVVLCTGLVGGDGGDADGLRGFGGLDSGLGISDT